MGDLGDYWKAHKEEMHVIEYKPIVYQTESIKKRYICECGRTFATLSGYGQHKMTKGKQGHSLLNVPSEKK